MTNKHELLRQDTPIPFAVAVPQPLRELSEDELNKVVGGNAPALQRENTMFNSVGNIR